MRRGLARLCIAVLSAVLTLGIAGASPAAEPNRTYPVGIKQVEFADANYGPRTLSMAVFYPAVIDETSVKPFVMPFFTKLDLYKDAEITFDGEKRPLVMAMGRAYDLPYSVELWDDADSHVEELIPLTGDYRVARAASSAATAISLLRPQRPLRPLRPARVYQCSPQSVVAADRPFGRARRGNSNNCLCRKRGSSCRCCHFFRTVARVVPPVMSNPPPEWQMTGLRSWSDPHASCVVTNQSQAPSFKPPRSRPLSP